MTAAAETARSKSEEPWLSEDADIRLECHLVSSLDPAEWLSQHTFGLAPDRVPYGLDRISGYGFDIRAMRPSDSVRRVSDRIQATLKLSFDWASVMQPRFGRAVLCWDERTGVPAAWLPGRPVFTGVIWATELPRSQLIAGALRRAAGVFTLSKAQLPILRAWGVRNPTYLPMGVDPSFFVPGLADPTSGPTLLTVGNDQHRDFDTVMSAHRELGQGRPPLCIVTRRRISVSSPGVTVVPALSHRELAIQYGRAAVVIIGLRRNLHASGITTALEAMACARPIVVSDTPGMRDYVEHGKTGVLVPVGDPTAMAAAVRDLIAEPHAAALMGQRARAAVLAEFTTEHLAQRLAGWMSERL